MNRYNWTRFSYATCSVYKDYEELVSWVNHIPVDDSLQFLFATRHLNLVPIQPPNIGKLDNIYDTYGDNYKYIGKRFGMTDRLGWINHPVDNQVLVLTRDSSFYCYGNNHLTVLLNILGEWIIIGYSDKANPKKLRTTRRRILKQYKQFYFDTAIFRNLANEIPKSPAF